MTPPDLLTRLAALHEAATEDNDLWIWYGEDENHNQSWCIAYDHEVRDFRDCSQGLAYEDDVRKGVDHFLCPLDHLALTHKSSPLLLAEIRRLRGALRTYADERNYERQEGKCGPMDAFVETDNGETARAALAAHERAIMGEGKETR